MKTVIQGSATVLLLLVLSGLAKADPVATPDVVVFTGTEYSGTPCSLTIHNAQSTHAEEGWDSFHVVASTPWQGEVQTPFNLHLSWTPYALYAKSETTGDEMSMDFAFTKLPTLEGLRAFTFQQKRATGLFQAHCQNLKIQAGLSSDL